MIDTISFYPTLDENEVRRLLTDIFIIKEVEV